MKKLLLIAVLAVVATAAAQAQTTPQDSLRAEQAQRKALENLHKNDDKKLAEAARSLLDSTTYYNPEYVRIPYPGGDVPAFTGVCSDVLIRAFRKGLNWDLQKSVHDFRLAQGKDIDTNIDHRRVKNLMEYFDYVSSLHEYTGQLHSKGTKAALKPGDVIIWRLGYYQLHCGIMVSSTEVMHNMGGGQIIEPISEVYGTIIRVYGFHD